MPDRPQATVVKGVVLCSKCQCECELEVPASSTIIDQELVRIKEIEEHDARRSVMRVAEKVTSKNVFQRLGGDSEPKGLSEVFRNYEASQEVKDKKAKMPRWVNVKSPQPSYNGSMRQWWREKTMNPISPVTKKDSARLDRKWYIVEKDG